MDGGSPAPPDGGVEFVIERSGGLCPSPDGGGAVCRLTVVVTDDGSWDAGGSPPPNTAGGALPTGSASRLAAIFDGGWEALTAQQFTGTCPTAYDGQEVSYTVRRLPRGEAASLADADVREIRSCTYDLDHPAAQAVISRLNELWRSLELPG
jgi:hypothetical protein